MHHEYMVHIVQPLAVRRYQGLAERSEALRILAETHLAAVQYSEAGHWGDSSNKISWLIADLAELMPRTKFVHLVRDGRKVASSYFHKLAGECYDDRSTAILAAHIADPARHAAPPPEKKYWWPQPRAEAPFAMEFSGFSQFERICWHWAEVNRVIRESLESLPASQKHFVRLEELESEPVSVRVLFEFLGLHFSDDHFHMFRRPHNVNRPEDRLLDHQQTASFWRIAGAMMEELGYSGTPEYVVNY